MRLRHKPIPLAPDHLLHDYWGGMGFHRPIVNLLLYSRSGQVVKQDALLDTGSPYILFDESVAGSLGLSPPFRRQTSGQAAGGIELLLSFPEDGEVTLLLTDFHSEHYVWQPLVGFLRPPSSPQTGTVPKQTALLGTTGFFQFFDVLFPRRKSR